ncbi:MAG: M14 family metallopeptidase [Acidobacteria bacterium]|nr:M14 family metallopeptidase [Acidobacteriota bacterium]
MRSTVCSLGLLASLILVVAPRAGGSDGASLQAVLPPVANWAGKSLSLVAGEDDPWITPCEARGLLRTPPSVETMAWLADLTAAAPEIRMLSIGRSHEGREINMFLVSLEGAATPGRMAANGRPVVLVQGGIHAGEIDGKDAGMMLLRDMTVAGKRRALLEKVNVLFIPILNVDGHERFSAWGRINQRGPAEMGWRTNARNQNLNRDYAKLDTPEIRALVGVINEWRPDLYVDIHVTDGMDFQYDITWGYNGPHAYSPAAAGWLENRLTPAADRALTAMGHIPGPLFFPVDGRDMSRGLIQWTASPRFSNGYGDARHLATVLVENHSLKPFGQRVLGTYVFLRSVLETLGAHGDELRRANILDRARRLNALPLSWKIPSSRAPEKFTLSGIEQERVPSEISGGERVVWTGREVSQDVPWMVADEVVKAVTPPVAYWIPPQWQEVISRLKLHGIQMKTLSREKTIRVEMYRLQEPELDGSPFEGHVRVKADTVMEERDERYAVGSVRVPVDQPLGALAMLLLEPAAPDSFFRWGFFLEVLQATEYVEDYVMDPMAQQMLADDPELAGQFRQALTDRSFAGDPGRRLRWFYRRTAWSDDRWNLYPVGREVPVSAAHNR